MAFKSIPTPCSAAGDGSIRDDNGAIPQKSICKQAVKTSNTTKYCHYFTIAWSSWHSLFVELGHGVTIFHLQRVKFIRKINLC